MSTNTANVLTGEGWRDSIEALVRDRIRSLIEEILEEELSGALGRARYARCKTEPAAVVDISKGLGGCPWRNILPAQPRDRFEPLAPGGAATPRYLFTHTRLRETAQAAYSWLLRNSNYKSHARRNEQSQSQPRGRIRRVAEQRQPQPYDGVGARPDAARN
jgi:hypothetical protein